MTALAFRPLILTALVLWCCAPAARAASPAFDSAADPAYNFKPQSGSGWTQGSNGGYGWGSPWRDAVFPRSTGDLIGIIGSSTTNGNGDVDGDGDINTPRNAAGRAFGFTSAAPSNDFPGGGEGANYRLFQGTLSVGQTFSIDMDNGFIANVVLLDGKHHVGSVGWGLAGPDLTEKIGVSTGGLVNHYFITGNGTIFDSGIPLTTEGIHCAFTLLPPVDPFSPPQWTMQITPLSPGGQTYTFNGTIPTSLDRFAVGDTGAGSDPANAAYFNNISVTGVPEPGTAGLLSLGCAALLVRRRAR